MTYTTDISDLTAAFSGTLHAPASEGYDEARSI